VYVTVELVRSKEIKKIELEKGSIVEDLLKKMNLKPDTLIIMNGDNPIPINDQLRDKQKLTIIQVASGG